MVDVSGVIEELLSICKDMIIPMKGDGHDDLKYMCQAFFLRQIDHMQSLVLLKESCDAQLISRSMFEGALYLMYASKDAQVATRWRKYCIVLDKQKIDFSDKRGLPVPPEIRAYIDSQLPDCDRLFKREDGSYAATWRDDESIYSIVKKVGFERLYDEYYYPMSDYHHWGTESVGKRFALKDGKVYLTKDVETDRASAIRLAISCLLSTADFANVLFECGMSARLEQMKAQLQNVFKTGVYTIPI
ncbi:hypothetical protein HBR94_16160 [Pseudomonas sp. WS 5412]|nr:DUF5677 domain-containing protein [Pseudomonas sp. WS 5412]NMY33033.1 hypothetical protein [Pseudomonas sp. WS 5412]